MSFICINITILHGYVQETVKLYLRLFVIVIKSFAVLK